MSVLDFSKVTDAAALSGIQQIHNMGVILIPETLMDALMKIPIHNMGSIIPLPAGANFKVKLLMGQSKLSGEALAAAAEDEIWIVTGQLIITTVVREFKGHELQVTGQVLAPQGSETALGAKISKLQGQIVYFKPGARLVLGKENWSREFLQLLPAPVAFCIAGKVTIEDDVTPELLQSKVTEIALVGKIRAPQALVPLVQVLAVENLGKIQSHDDKP